MRNIIAFAVKNRVTILMVVLGILLLGKISYDELGTDLLPNLNNPRLYVEVEAGERPPEEIEKNVIRNMESQIIRQNNVIGVTSVIKAGSARITVDYSYKTEMNEAFLDLQKALAGFAQNQNITGFNISQNDPNSAPVIVAGVTHDQIQDMAQLRRVAESFIRNELIRVEGVADVKLTGSEVKNLVIRTDDYKLKAFNITPDVIVSKIKESNQNLSGARISDLGRQYIVKGVSGLNSPEDFGALIVGYKAPEGEKSTSANSNSGQASGDKAPIFLRDVAKVDFENDDPLNIVRINGKRSIGLSVYKEVRYNTVKVTEQVEKELQRVAKGLPGYHFEIISNQGTFIRDAIGEVKFTALFGILLAIIVIFLFLRRLGTTLIISIAIPISIVATFSLMYFGGLTLNIMTLGGLALGAGMLVDNAIVVIESIFRNRERGVTAKEAAIEGTSTVAMAITASTLTTIVVFLPIVYLHDLSGELFKDQAWTVTFSLLSSLFVAILVIPMLYCAIAGKEGKKTPSLLPRDLPFGKSDSVEFPAYGRLLRRILNHKKLVLGGAVATLIVTAAFVPFLKSEFIPQSEGGNFDVHLRLAEGTPLSVTAQTVAGMEKIIAEIANDSSMVCYSHAGPGSEESKTSFEGENTARIRVILRAKKTSVREVIARINSYAEAIPNLSCTISQEDHTTGSFGGDEISPVVVEVAGAELDEIARITEEMHREMTQMEGLCNLKSSIEDGSPEVRIRLDRVFCGMNNIALGNVVTQCAQKLEGAQAGQMEYEGEQRDIRIKLPEVPLAELENIGIQAGEKRFRLGDMAALTVSQAPREIIRKNQTRLSKITADLNPGASLQEEAFKIRQISERIDLPHNYSIRVTGQEEQRSESMRSLLFALILSVVLVYMVLSSQFESLIHPFTILLTIPLAMTGAILLFLITGMTLNIMAVIGMVMLTGIAVNNSIILVDRINQLKRSGTPLNEAIVEAGQQRIRPILMTTLTTILALLPLCITFGDGAALRAPMAIAVIGGLISATASSLIVIPCLYTVFERIAKRV